MNDFTRKHLKCLQNNKPHKDESECPHWINSPKHMNCLWVYIKAKSGPDGAMVELVQSEIADLMGWSNTKTHFMLREANLELIEALNKNKAKLLLSGSPELGADVDFSGIEPVNTSVDDIEE